MLKKMLNLPQLKHVENSSWSESGEAAFVLTKKYNNSLSYLIGWFIHFFLREKLQQDK